MATNYILPPGLHIQIVAAAYRKRGCSADEADAGTRVSELTAWHGIKTHNAIKALHLDEHFGSKAGMLPGQIEAAGAALRAKHGGLLVTKTEIDAFEEIGKEGGVKFDAASLKTVEIA